MTIAIILLVLALITRLICEPNWWNWIETETEMEMAGGTNIYFPKIHVDDITIVGYVEKLNSKTLRQKCASSNWWSTYCLQKNFKRNNCKKKVLTALKRIFNSNNINNWDTKWCLKFLKHNWRTKKNIISILKRR